MDANPDDEYRRERELIYRLQTAKPYVTIGILAVCIALWAATCLSLANPSPFRTPEDSTLIAFGAQLNGGPEQYEWWRMFSSAFLHLGIVHLACNGYVLWMLGRFQEAFLGRGRFLLVYMTSALTASLASLWFLAPKEPSIGASGAVFGMLGAQLVFEMTKTLPSGMQRSLKKGVLPWIVGNLVVLQVINHFSDTVQVNNIAHVGGLLGGMLVAFALRGRPAGTDERIGAADIAGWLLALVALGCVAMGVWNGIHQDPEYLLFGHPL